MQFNLKLAGAAPDTDAIRQALHEADPSSMVDIEPHGQSLRIASSMDADELAAVISQAGHPVAGSELQRLPSECCGGCGG